MIEIKSLSKKYGGTLALDQFSFFAENGIYGLLGPNGAGKTTLMRILATVLSSDGGEIILDGINYNNKKQIRKKIGYLPQKFDYYKGLKVIDVLRGIAIMKELNPDTIESSILKVADYTNLNDKLTSRVGTLSGGMIRRLGIAQALLGEPDLILVDEPTAGLDPEERIRLRSILGNLSKDRLIIISTHIVEDVQFICDKISILSRGKLLITDSGDNLIRHSYGHIWESLNLSEEQQHRVKIISNLRTTEGVLYRFITREHIDGARKVSVTLEDVYMDIIHEADSQV